VRIAPFYGVTGVAWDEPGEHSTIPPRPAGGGNIDCKELVAESILYLPVAVPGALLSIGDGHAAQGDGEVAGTAIECGMTTELQSSWLRTGGFQQCTRRLRLARSPLASARISTRPWAMRSTRC
jgi:acetamidase/formamidase